MNIYVKDTEAIASMHSNHIKDQLDLDGLILGGSNSWYSLSGEQLSNDLSENWYNLSLPYQGYSDQNYWQFVNTALSQNQKELVSNVVYSSMSAFGRANYLSKRAKVSHGLKGDHTFRLIGERSNASYLKQLFLHGKLKRGIFLPTPNSYGDFVFKEYSCRLDKNIIFFERNTNVKQLSQWVRDELDSISSSFVNAHIYFVVPSQYYGEKFDSELARITTSIIKTEINNHRASKAGLITFIEQPNYSEAKLICDRQHHANKVGRTWRTNDLINQIKASQF